MKYILVSLIAVVLFGFGGGRVLAESTDSLDCIIEPRSVIELKSADEGIIRQILVGRGDRVTAGSVLVQLDDAIERLQVELASVRANSDVEVRSQHARLGLRRRELGRAKELRNKKAISSSEFDEAKIEMSLNELSVESAIIEQKLAQIEYKQAKARLDRRHLTSPVDGVVLSVEAEPGEFSHEQQTILKIAEIATLHVEVYAPAAMFGKIAVGQVYEVRPLAPVPGVFKARVSVVDPVFDAASGTFGVRLETPNPDGNIPAGIRCSLRMSPS